MPIQINELIIRATIGSQKNTTTETKEQPSVDQQEIIQNCVEQVLEILKNKYER